MTNRAIELALSKDSLDKTDIVAILSATDRQDLHAIRDRASEVLKQYCGDEVYFRGLVEFSNECVNNCIYCGIRLGNPNVQRYLLSEDDIVASALWCADKGYGSVVLQSGERHDRQFVELVERSVRRIKNESRSERLPGGLGITLCVGEQKREDYERFFAAGAHRYLLRIESSSPELYARIHPDNQKWDDRLACLRWLREIGFQVGTGVMIGLPGQTLQHLADDILFFREIDVDMIGMGPYIPHNETPLAADHAEYGWQTEDAYRTALLMIAAARIALKDINIAATTALQALRPLGREEGLNFGANVVMPQLTPMDVRRNYLLYEGKPCLDESAEQCLDCLETRIRSIGRRVGCDAWGDSRHALARGARADTTARS
jgi:biotin synthase